MRDFRFETKDLLQTISYLTGQLSNASLHGTSINDKRVNEEQGKVIASLGNLIDTLRETLNTCERYDIILSGITYELYKEGKIK